MAIHATPDHWAWREGPVEHPGQTVVFDMDGVLSDATSRQHFLDMFFGSQSESFAGVYEELSSGRYTVDGDVSDWVKVPHNEASYGETESQADMTRFIDDGAEAWYAQQKAAGAALSAKRGDTPKSKLQGASKSMMSMTSATAFAVIRNTFAAPFRGPG